jgi:uncharacterized UPF0160 family protein
MPNWVYNGLTIEGSPDSVKKLMEQMNTPFVRVHDNWDIATQQMQKQQVTYPNPVFAFWNIVKPTNLEAYDGPQPKTENFEQAMRFESDHWYDWNVRNWGTKWDVAVSSVETNPDTYMEDTVNGENHVVYYNFETAWSRPMGALTKLSEQYPDLLFTLVYEEETGWGGECEILRGKVISESEYDNMCRNCDGTYLDIEITGCDDCGDYPCPHCGWSNDMCETHQKTYEEKHA